MARTKEQKKEIVGALEEKLRGAASAVFVHFRGVNVTQETTMRRSLREDQLGYTVAKKSLIRRALTALGHEHESVPLEGEIALAYNFSKDGDPTLAARRIFGYGKEFGAENISIVGGIFEGKVVDAKMMNEIATIPGMEALRGMFANIINSPLQRFAIVLSKVAEKQA